MAEIVVGTKVRITNGGIWHGYTGKVVKLGIVHHLVALDNASGNDVPLRGFYFGADFEVLEPNGR